VVNFSNFLSLDPEASRLARQLLDSADRRRSDFMSFALTWMAFNGWMESVTDVERDSEMITALAENPRITNVYDDLMRTSDEFRRRVIAFAAMWPVLNVRDVRRKLGWDAFWRYRREELLKVCEQRRVRQEPLGWSDGDVPTWPQLLRTIYSIRCNLFHGAKSPQNARDHDLVCHADWILRTFIAGSGCLGWAD
jgi:hypothetical protein